MSAVLKIDPVTRIEGHLSIRVTIDTVNGIQQVVDAWSTGTLFRGFEKMLLGRDPRDAQHITQRVCGVCPTPHAMAAVNALDNAYGVTIPVNALLMRNLVLGANFIQSHILHFYILSLLDYTSGADMPVWKPSYQTDMRIDSTKATQLFNNYVSALDMHRKAQEMGAIFAGRLPHTPAFLPGGITATPTSANITLFKSYLNQVISFINNVYIPDAEYVASVYSDYFDRGAGYGNLLSFGVFDKDVAGTSQFIRGGIAVGGSKTIQPLHINLITEDVTFSWYADSTNNLRPSAGDTVPQYPKANAYSWLKAPRYNNQPFEAGALSRMWINGDYREGISVMDRHLARAIEARKLANKMKTWVNSIIPGQPVYAKHTPAVEADTFGLTEAPRGALGHWVQIRSSKISRYQIITPTCWNASPSDDSGSRGPLEMSLIGTPVINVREPIEILRVIHSFDPCLACAVHVMDTKDNSAIKISVL
jgi:hydrogenase large subunit